MVLDEKSMIGRANFGRVDRRSRQANPRKSDEILGGIPTILFGDFSQLPPIGDTPLYSTREPKFKKALHEEGRRAFESFTQTVTLGQVFRQEGNDPQQVKFRDALMRLRDYATTDEDYHLFASRMWDNLTPVQRSEFDDVLYLLPTKAAVHELNCRKLAAMAKPVLRCLAKHNLPEAKKASDEDAEGLEKEILLAEGAKVMLTRNLWTSKGLVNGSQGIVRKIWFNHGTNPRSHLPAVVFVEFDGYNGKFFIFFQILIILTGLQGQIHLHGQEYSQDGFQLFLRLCNGRTSQGNFYHAANFLLPWHGPSQYIKAKD